MATPYEMVQASRIYGTGLDIGALAGRIAGEAAGVSGAVRSLRDGVQPYISSHESSQLDTLLRDMGILQDSPPVVPTPPSLPTVLFAIPTTPGDAGELQFPPVDAPMSVKEAFYTSQAYYDYMMRRTQSTAPYQGGMDSIFDNYVLNGVLSYQGNTNLDGARAYMANISAFNRDYLAGKAQASASAKGFDLTTNEASILLSGGTLTMVLRPDGKFVTVDRYMNPSDIVVTAPRAFPPASLTSAGLATLGTGGIVFLPISLSTEPSGITVDGKTYRKLNADERFQLKDMFGDVDLDSVMIIFGDGNNYIARTAFASSHRPAAITLGNYIYFNSQPRNLWFGQDLKLLFHEFAHVLQYRQFGVAEVWRRIAFQSVEFAVKGPYNYWLYPKNYSALPLEGRAELVADYAYFRLYGQLPAHLHDGSPITQQILEQYLSGSGLFGK